MAANNNNGGPPWYPEYEPSLKPRTNDWMRLFTDNVYALRGQTANLNETIQSVNQNVTQQITKLAANFNAAANNANNAAVQGPVIYGTHGARVASYSAATYAGYLYVETDRFQSCFYANGSIWILVEGIATGAFEFRYAGLNQADQGLTWIETSRNNVAGLPPYPTYRWSGAQWSYQSGQFYRPQNGLATLAGTFNSANSNFGNDAGAIVNVTDFAGQLQWQNNNTWYWGPNDDGSHGEMRIREVDPTGAWWQLYDGSNNVSYLQANGNVGNVNLPNLVSANNVAFLEFGNVGSGVNPAVAPTFAGGNFTANGNVSAVFTGSPLPAHSHDSPVGLDANNNLVYVANVGANNNSNGFSSGNYTMSEVSGVLAFAANNSNRAVLVTGAVSAGTPTGSIAASFAGTPGSITGNISNNGQPPSIVRRAWFRR